MIREHTVGTSRTLRSLKEGQLARVSGLRATGSIRRRLLDLGIIEGTRIECLRHSPFGDPIAYLIRGAAIALRGEDSDNVLVCAE